MEKGQQWYLASGPPDHDVEVPYLAGQRVGMRRFAHSHEGLHELQAFLLAIAPAPEELACIVETNHGLLITFLLEAGIPLYPVNPKLANQLRTAAGAQTDRIDAHVLAKLGRLDLADLRRLEPDSATVAELKTLTRDQDAFLQAQTRLEKGLTACLQEDSPAALHLFARVQQRSTLVFLQTSPTPQAAASASLAEITATLRAGKHTNPKEAAPKIVEALQHPQLAASPVIVRAKARLMLSLVKQLLVVLEEIKGYDEAIRTLFLTHADHDLWSSLPRAGKRLAPRLLAEWGEDRSRYPDATSVQALAGTAPVPFESGTFAKAHTRFACLKPLRNALHQFAWHSTRQEAWARDYYQRKRAQGKTHSMAVRCLANVWVRIIYRLWVNKTSSQAATFEAARQAHAPRQHAA
jgi:transposase